MELCPVPVWERLAQADSTCTFYQTPAWHAIAARHFHAESIPLYFRFNDTEACLPLLKDRRKGRDRYFSPFGTYTALVCPEKLSPEKISPVVSVLKKLNLHLISSPFTRNPVTVGKPLMSKIQVIDLKSLDAENPVRDWDEGQRRRARVAQRENVVVRLAQSESDWDRYYELYRLSLQRWGKTATVAYPKALFDDIRNSLSGGAAMKLWLAEHEGEVGAGYLTFYHNRHVVPWHGAADEKFFALGATQILFLRQIEDALQRGFGFFDLTGSGGLSGVESFKSRFGTKTIEFESSLNRPGLLGVAAGIRDLFSGFGKKK